MSPPRIRPQTLANAARAYATAGVVTLSLFYAIAVAAPRKPDEFDSRDHANTARVCAYTGVAAPVLFNATAGRLPARLDELPCAECAQLHQVLLVLQLDAPRRSFLLVLLEKLARTRRCSQEAYVGSASAPSREARAGSRRLSLG